MSNYQPEQKVKIIRASRSQHLGRIATIKAVDAFQHGYLTLQIGKSKKVFFFPENFVKAVK